jgi:hypothetical protein
MIGFEAELDRRVVDMSGLKMKGDEKLAICAGGQFTVVTDAKSAWETTGSGKTLSYSNIELVTSPFDQMTGDFGPIVKALDNMRVLTGYLYKVGGAPRLREVLQHSGIQFGLTKAGMAAMMRPDTDLIGPVEGAYYKVNDKGADSLFVHYTAGFPVLDLGTALDWLAGKVRDTAEDGPSGYFPSTNVRRAQLAGRAAAELFRRWSVYRKLDTKLDTKTDSTALAGYIALVYTQLAAAIDHSYNPEGQVKNKAIAVCRVPLRNVARALPESAQRFLREQAWVDMLTDYKVGKTADSMQRFLNARGKEAAKTAADKRASGTAATKELMGLQKGISDVESKLKAIEDKLAMIGEHEDPTGLMAERDMVFAELDARKADAVKKQDIIADYTGAETAGKEWSALLSGLPPELSKLTDEQIAGQFPWSLISHAISPALEGRPLAHDLTSQAVDSLFTGGPLTDGKVAPDKGIVRELATGTESNMDGDPVTLGQYLCSALLAPAQRTLGPTKIFGGMHEVANPDIFLGRDGIARYLIPLELRSHGPQRVNWDQLGGALNELSLFTLKLAG